MLNTSCQKSIKLDELNKKKIAILTRQIPKNINSLAENLRHLKDMTGDFVRRHNEKIIAGTPDSKQNTIIARSYPTSR
ncbi:hypothetical protein [Spirulina sp. 06S082]|uniref:hypothetical protein n=1 Tax=Spirulina sp. 06S082 TaxID=3110248 RepID=UPI002B20A000|nr:hypothetical protein [Spirulina sp. 06S082]MEA5467715.1 hypothetical protein [Spirulina sp. 06S082]